MLSERLGQSAIILLACGFFTGAHGAIVYSESAQGDFADSGLTPTVVSVDSGSNQIFGATGNPGGGEPGAGIDLDYFVISVPSGMRLSAISVLPGTSVGGVLSFIGVQAGSQVTVLPNATTAAGLLGWTHYSTADINSDILARMGTGFGASGFVPPLGAGSYAFWVQEFNAGTFNYGFDLTLTAIPEPAIYTSLVAGLASLLGLALRRRHHATQTHHTLRPQ